MRRALEPLERVDLLVNNAGLAAGLEHIDRGDTRDWDAMIDTNVKGLLYVTRVIAPKMVAAGRGHIFNIGSIAGTEPYENGAVTAPRSTPCTPFRSRCAPTCSQRA